MQAETDIEQRKNNGFLEGFSNRVDKTRLLNQLSIIIAVIIVGSVLVYGVNTQASRSLFYFLVIIFYFILRDKVLATALLFILILNPWGLFYYRPHDWVLQATSTVGVSYRTLFILAIAVKAFYYKEFVKPRLRNYIKNYYYPIAFYIVFLISFGLVFGHNTKSLYDLFTSLPVWVVFIIIPVAMNTQQLNQFNGLIILFTLIHVIISIVDIISGGLITSILIFGRDASTAAIWGEELIRLTGGIGLSLYSLIISFYYLSMKDKPHKTWYLWVSVVLAVIYIANSGTRGWIIATAVIVLFWLIYYSRDVLVRRGVVITLVIIMILAYLIAPSGIKRNINQAYIRLTTVEAIAEGDFTAGGTARRWDIRGPRTLTLFNESPLFGYGFSKVTSEYYDGHVGNHSLLLMGGVTGLLLVWITVISLMVKLFRLEKSRSKMKGLFVFALALMAIMIIHSTSRIMISFQMPIDMAFTLSLFFNHINVHIANFEERLTTKSVETIKVWK